MNATNVPTTIENVAETKENFSVIWLIFRLIRMPLYGFLLIHFLGTFGVLVALSYPLIWLLTPNRVFCFVCLRAVLIGKERYCPVCKREIVTIFNPGLRSVLINAMGLFFASILFMPVIVLEVALLTRGTFDLSTLFYTRSSFVIPDKRSYPSSESFYFDIEIKNLGQPINYIDASLSFSNELFQVREISTVNSFATVFTRKEYSNEDGTLYVSGGLPNPGFVGDKGLFARVWFKPLKPGIGEIRFLDTSKILANDGKGTDISDSFVTIPVVIE